MVELLRPGEMRWSVTHIEQLDGMPFARVRLEVGMHDPKMRPLYIHFEIPLLPAWGDTITTVGDEAIAMAKTLVNTAAILLAAAHRAPG